MVLTDSGVKSAYVKETSKTNTIRLISMMFTASFFLMPQYVGIRLPGFDFTVNRIFLVILYLCILADEHRSQRFARMVRQYRYLFPVLLFEIVLVYTGGLRGDIGTIMNATIEFLFLFLLIFVIRYEIGIVLFAKITRICGYILCLLGIQEYVTGVNLFHKMQTLKANFSQYIRSGNLRIMGPCGHALAYGLLLLLILSMACIDWEKKSVDILQHKILFALITINVFLTGSRSSLGIFLLAVGLIFLLSPKERKRKAVLLLLMAVAAVAGFVVVFPGNGISRYIMLQVTSVLDTVLGTKLSIAYGAELSRLDNSTYYRKVLPKIFFLNYLNPVLGRGASRHSSFLIDGIAVISIDNFYAAQYVRYAYTGLFAYMWFVLAAAVDMLKGLFQKKSAICGTVFSVLLCYYINLWWMDSLQTLRYAYAFFAVIYVYMMQEGFFGAEDKGKGVYESKYIRGRVSFGE